MCFEFVQTYLARLGRSRLKSLNFNIDCKTILDELSLKNLSVGIS